MAKIEKTKDGLYRMRVFLYKDSNGKPIQKTVTGKTKRDVEKIAGQLRADNARLPGELPLSDAVHAFVASRADTSIYSPTTYAGYVSAEKSMLEKCPDIMRKNIHSLQAADFDIFFNDLSRQGLSAKTLRNFRGILSGAYRVAGLSTPDLTDNTKRLLKKTDGQQTITRDVADDDSLYTPDYFPRKDDVIACIQCAKLRRPDLVVPIALAAYCGLRRSEICGLTMRDIDADAGTVTISRALVKSGKSYVYKTTKTDGSRRVVPVPRVLLDMINAQGYIYKKTPKSLSDAWEHIIRSCVRAGTAGGVFRFHDLRHFAAAWWMTELRFDVKMCMTLGGWTDQRTLLNIYAYVLSDAKENAARNIDRAGNASLHDAGL